MYKNTSRSVEFRGEEFNELWKKVEDRYEAENEGKKLRPNQHAELVVHLRRFPEAAKHLPVSTDGDKSGLAIYNAYREAQKPGSVKLGNDYAQALIAYASQPAHTPFTEYKEYLRSFYTKKGQLVEGAISLKDIYIEPRIIETYRFNEKFHEKPLCDTVVKWITGEVEISKRHNNILIILGDPGQGKTSFCSRLLYEIADRESVYFFRIRDIQRIELFYGNEPFSALKTEMAQQGYNQKYIPLPKNGFEDAVLILDGLDELEKIHNKDKDEFLQKFAIQTNWVGAPKKLIITSRKEVSVYHLFNNGICAWTLSEFELEDQQLWINKYNLNPNVSYHLEAEELAELNRNPATFPLVRQAIILHIMANLNFRPGQSNNASQIYNELFNRLIERNWENRSEHAVLNKYIKSSNDLRQVLHELALAMFKQKKDCLSAEYIPTIIQEKWNLKNQSDFRDLLLAFYFKELNQNEFAVEFLHKTFGEYLVAEAIWYRIKTIFIEAENSVDDILKSITYLFNGKAFLTKEIINYLYDLINDFKKDRVLDNSIRELSEILISRMSDSLPSLIGAEFYYPDANKDVLSQSARVFYGFISVYLRVNYKEFPYSQIVLRDFSMLINMLAFKNKGLLNLKGTYLRKIDLVGIDLSKADLREADLMGSNLSGADLRDADLMGADLSRTLLTGALLIRANLKKANLSESYLTKADLISANLEGANLTDANLADTYMIGTNLKGASFIGADLKRTNLKGADLAGADLSNADLRGTNLRGTSLTEAKLAGANLMDSILEGVNLKKINLTGAKLSNNDLQRYDLTGANLTGADLRGANLTGADLRGANLSNADLARTNLLNADLRGTNLRGASLTEAKLAGANLSNNGLQRYDLRGANLSNANLTGADLRGANLAGADLRGANLSNADLAGADLSNADLRGTNLRGASLTEAKLAGANLMYSILEGVNLKKINLTGANLSNNGLQRYDLRGANLSNANLAGADLRGANLAGADLRGANLTGADLTRTNLLNADLRGTNLSDASLTEAKLAGANLMYSILEGVNLKKINLTGAKLSNNDL
ncbi:pentapeptide repeat-containing protein [Runella sp.]|uniref:pentapeptide repeat-containing protein n=1 Tax=Runella sp. TaxID=1960881 RepID=UPI003D0B4F37